MRRIALLVAAAAVIAVLGASTAHAQSVEVTKESNATHCPEISVTNHIVEGGCELHLAQHTIAAFIRNMGMFVSNCTIEMTMVVDEGGFGYFTDQRFTGPNCFIEPCREGGVSGPKKEWSFQISENGANSEHIFTAWCWRTMLGEFTCNTEFKWEHLGTHYHEMRGLFGQPAVCDGTMVTIEGDWSTEVDDAIEVTHL